MQDHQAKLNDQLNFAAQKGDHKCVKELIESGADIHSFDELSKTTLHYAAENGSSHIVHMLIEKGANVNSHNSDHAGDTPTIVATENGHFKIVKMLLNAGADPYIGGWMQIDALERSELRKDSVGDRIKELILKKCLLPKDRKYRRR